MLIYVKRTGPDSYVIGGWPNQPMHFTSGDMVFGYLEMVKRSSFGDDAEFDLSGISRAFRAGLEARLSSIAEESL